MEVNWQLQTAEPKPTILSNSEPVPDDRLVADDLLLLFPGFVPSDSTFQTQGAIHFAALASGGFVAVWMGTDGFNNPGILAQMYDAFGREVGDEFRINTITDGSQILPDVTALDDGGFLVVWNSDGPDATFFDVIAQRFDANGDRVGVEFIVNTTLEGGQTNPQIQSLVGGGFVVLWEGNQSFSAQLYDAAGTPVGGNFPIDNTSASSPEITALAGGGFVAVWRDGLGDQPASGSASAGILAQIYDAQGALVGGAFSLNDFQSGQQGQPDIVGLPGGGFAAVWADNGTHFGQSTGNQGIWLRLFDSSGQPLGDEVKVNQLGSNAGDLPHIEIVDGVGFLVVWKDFNSGEGFSIGHLRGQLFDFGGSRIGEEFVVEDTGAGGLFPSDIVALDNGSLVVGWERDSDVYARIINLPTRGTSDADSISGAAESDMILGFAGDDTLAGGLNPDWIEGGDGSDRLLGGDGDDLLFGGHGVDELIGGADNDAIDGGSNVDTAVVSGTQDSYTIEQTSTGVFEVTGADGTDILTAVEYLQFDDALMRLLPGTGVAVNFETADPSVYQDAMNSIRDFDGNALGGDGGWLRIGSADVNGDGDVDQVLVNQTIGRFATVGTADDGLVYYEDYSWAGETRVAGIYIDPLVASGAVEAGSDNDSQRRFQNDLQIENINRVLGADDYDGDGLQEVYFALTDGTAYLHAYMHADGNIEYANYQSEQEVIDFLTANGFGPEVYADWFPSDAEASQAESQVTANEGQPKRIHAFADDVWVSGNVEPNSLELAQFQFDEAFA